jgi:putative membrane protein insertion efficiency factor
MSKLVLNLIKAYKKYISPYLIYSKCRFYPTCSDYMSQAILKHGLALGFYLGFKRLLRCNIIFFRGGYDPVP